MTTKHGIAVRLAGAAGLTCALTMALAGAGRAQGFHAVHTRDGTDIWAVGGAGVVYRSLNGGVTWASMLVGAGTHRAVAARGARVWIADGDGTLWTSLDTGHSFAGSVPAPGNGLHAISFVDDLVGWIAGDNGTILKTTDGGASWSAQATPFPGHLYAIRFRDALEGWACGANGYVLHTTNGGTTWIEIAPFPLTKDLTDVDFLGGLVYVSGTHGGLAQSVDAGVTWTVIPLKLTSRSDVNGLALHPSGVLWLCGGGGFLRGTGDGGASWFYPQHTLMTGLTDIQFIDESRGWACAGRSKLVARTTDGGNSWSVPGGGGYSYTWSQKYSNLGNSIRGNTLVIDPVNRNKLYAVQGRTVIASWNRGDTWSTIATIAGVGTRTNAFLVSAGDTNTWLAITQDGDRVTRTDNGGVTWTTVLAVPFTEYGLPLEQDVNDPDHVLYGPEDGHLYESWDFGLNWTQLANDPLFRSPDDIVVVPDTTGVLYLGDGVTGSGYGEIFKSINAGLDWELRRTGPSSEVPTIAATWLDRMLAYGTFWSTGGVVRSTDMGSTWSVVSTAGAAWGVDIARDDPNVVMFGVYSGGLSYLSTDRGATWKTAPLTGSNYAILTYDRGTFLAHQSGGIYKATVTQPDMPVSNVQTVALTAPNGGEAWSYDDLQPITWTGQNLSTVRLEYQNAPLAPWQPLALSAPGPPGTWSWRIPNDPTSEARVRVSDANDGIPEDVSDATFSILVPQLTAEPASMAFGSVTIGETKRDTLRIENPGTGTLVVTSVTVAGGGPFTPSRTSFSIPPGGSDTVVVVFAPSAIQTYEDTLRVAANAPGSPCRVPLTGAGLLTTAVDERDGILPLRFSMREVAPNPFGPGGTVIAYALAEEAEVSLTVFNVLGQRVATLVRGRQPAGRYAVRFPGAGQGISGAASALPSGVYFCRLRAGSFEASRRMMLLR